jgi:hypothetical protein
MICSKSFFKKLSAGLTTPRWRARSTIVCDSLFKGFLKMLCIGMRFCACVSFWLHLRLWSCLWLSLGLWPQASYATPVYLQLDSKIASGHYPRSYLEKKTKSVQVQRWVRVQRKVDGKFGWIAEYELITGLDLANNVIADETLPNRLTADLDAAWTTLIPPGAIGKIINRQDSWLRLVWNLGAESRVGWSPTESLSPLMREGDDAIVLGTAPLFSLPSMAARLNAVVRPLTLLRMLWFKMICILGIYHES